MEAQELLKKVRKIEIKTRGLSKNLFSGAYHTVFKGRGMTFSEVREYSPGDDVRHIDWNVTARSGIPHVKVFEEERELTLMLMIDISHSTHFGSNVQLKSEWIAEIAAVLAFAATQNHDKVGLLLYSDKVHLFIPPRKGRHNILRIIREIINAKTESSSTQLRTPLEYFNGNMHKRSICFIISDFYSDLPEISLKLVARKHDLIALHITDPLELNMKSSGLVNCRDAESGQELLVDFSSPGNRNRYKISQEQRAASLQSTLEKFQVSYLPVNTDDSYLQTLLKFFKSRSKR